MAIKPTPNNSMFKSLVFDGVDSRDYGIYITGEAVFNSPERDVEMIEIPGRNGAYALDKGRFSNIEVSYPAGIFGDTEADFRQGIRAFRNALASRKGYKRLEDEYNPDEYRMAVYKSGLEVTPKALKAGQFTITFDCQPQRFLKSGETAVTVASGDTITNPTLFESHPLISAYIDDAATLNIGDKTITYSPSVLGNVLLANGLIGQTFGHGSQYNIRLNRVPLRAGDDIYISAPFETTLYANFPQYIRYTESHTTGGLDLYSTAQSQDNTFVGYYKNPTPISFVAGTASTKTMTISIVLHYKNSPSGSEITATLTSTITVAYNGNMNYGIISITTQSSVSTPTDLGLNQYITTSQIYANSTSPTFNNTVYVDLDIDEAYIIENGEAVSLNNYVSLGSEPPVLEAGDNTIDYDGGISNVKITPRWWEV